MKKVALAVINFWFSISFIILACCNAPKKAQRVQEDLIENPAPITEPQTDSLKNYLDRERQRKKH